MTKSTSLVAPLKLFEAVNHNPISVVPVVKLALVGFCHPGEADGPEATRGAEGCIDR